MEREKEIQELKKRLESVESKLQHRSNSYKTIKFIIGFIITIVVLLILIGVFQFVSSS
ncbi:hypothetical protein [Paenibacillus sp. FJAT-27812]|uniref:hypothetical protein n=1 Tax=Paenibacillus sp. FJAT-27812 TaxID=1684143 RepID=UPI000A8EE081|nr:hypothetical protein [Paenibacillus sp. FJAT-27812]